MVSKQGVHSNAMIVIKSFLLAMVTVLLAASVAVVDDAAAQETVREKIKEKAKDRIDEAKAKDRIDEAREKIEEFKENPGLKGQPPEVIAEFREIVREKLRDAREAVEHFKKFWLEDRKLMDAWRSEGLTREEIDSRIMEDMSYSITERVRALKMIMNGEREVPVGASTRETDALSVDEAIEFTLEELVNELINAKMDAKRLAPNPPELTLDEIRSYAFQLDDIWTGVDTTSDLAKIFEGVEITGLRFSDDRIWITVDPYIGHATFKRISYELFHYWGDVVRYDLQKGAPLILDGGEPISTTHAPVNATVPEPMTGEELMPHLDEAFNVLIGNSTNRELAKIFENVSVTSLHIKEEMRLIDPETVMLADTMEVGLDCTGITAEQFDDRFSNLATGLQKYWGEKGVPYVLECRVEVPYTAGDPAAGGLAAQSGAHSSGTTVLTEDFESGLGRWSVHDNWQAEALDDGVAIPGHTTSNKVAEAEDCSPACILTLATQMDLSSYTTATLEFDRFEDGVLKSTDYLKVEVGKNGAYTQVLYYGDSSANDMWTHETYDMSGYLASGVTLRFTAKTTSSVIEVAVDNISITGSTEPPPPPAPRPTSLTEGFESGFGNWDVVGKWHTPKSVDGYGVPGASPTNKVAMSQDCSSCTLILKTPIDLTQYASATLELDRFVDNYGDTATLVVNVASGNTWKEAFRWDHSDGDDA